MNGAPTTPPPRRTAATGSDLLDHSAGPVDWRHGSRAHDGAVVTHGPDNSFLSQRVVAAVGIVMLPLGLLLVAAAGYTVAVLPDGAGGTAVLVAEGLGGLTVAVVGGFLYCGSWIARLAEDNQAANRRLAETLLTLTDVTAQASGASADVGALHVTVGGGPVVHRRDCPLVAYRPDLVPADFEDPGMLACRVCHG